MPDTQVESDVQAIEAGQRAAQPSGTTTDYKTDFYNKWAPYAYQAGSTLGVSPNVILAQWAHESNWGTSHVAQTTGNMAGINVPGSQTGTDYATFNSQQEFTNKYIQTMQNPAYSGSLNTGDNAKSFVAGLTATPGHKYFTGDPVAYTNRVSSIASTNPMGSVTAQIEGPSTETASATPTTPTASNALAPTGTAATTGSLGQVATGQTARTSVNPLLGATPSGATQAQPAPGQSIDPSRLVALAMMQQMVGGTHKLVPIDYDPFKTVKPLPQSSYQASEVPTAHVTSGAGVSGPASGATSGSTSGVSSLGLPGGSVSLTDLIGQYLGSTGRKSLRGPVYGGTEAGTS